MTARLTLSISEGGAATSYIATVLRIRDSVVLVGFEPASAPALAVSPTSTRIHPNCLHKVNARKFSKP